jgi:hypothetical protein
MVMDSTKCNYFIVQDYVVRELLYEREIGSNLFLYDFGG